MSRIHVTIKRHNRTHQNITLYDTAMVEPTVKHYKKLGYEVHVKRNPMKKRHKRKRNPSTAQIAIPLVAVAAVVGIYLWYRSTTPALVASPQIVAGQPTALAQQAVQGLQNLWSDITSS